MENYEQLKAVIQTANPEIMELKFGCELEGGVTFISVNPKTNEYYILAGNKILKRNEYRKILGRPIRLADVLLASTLEWSNIYEDRYLLMNLLKLWNLKDDNLDHQSEETKQFLIDLLTQ